MEKELHLCFKLSHLRNSQSLTENKTALRQQPSEHTNSLPEQGPRYNPLHGIMIKLLGFSSCYQILYFL